MEYEGKLEWCQTYAVSRCRSKDLRGDKILLPSSALEVMMRITNFATVEPEPDEHRGPAQGSGRGAGYGHDLALLPQPLTFRLVNKANGNFVHAGIREFSAEEGDVVLSPYLLEALGIDAKTIPDLTDGDAQEASTKEGESAQALPERLQVTVHAHQLPKGTYVRLRPLEAGYNPDDWKALLERQLRDNFTTLTNGGRLTVPGVRGEEFCFLVDKVSPEGDGICVVDTDLEVDIEALDEEQARETLRQIMEKGEKAPGTAAGSSVGHEINIWKAVDGQVLPGDYVDYELESWSKSRPLEIELSGLEDEYGVDLYISPRSSRQRARPRDSEHVFAIYNETGPGKKSVTLPPASVELEGAESILISVHGYLAPGTSTELLPRPYKLRAKAATEVAGTPMAFDSVEHTSDEEQCKNCQQWIPKRTVLLHENFCLRNNVTCPQCVQVFQKNSAEWDAHWHCPSDDAHGSSTQTKVKHEDIYHTDRQCVSCPFTTNSLPDLARHHVTLCPAKIILCRFCHLEVPQEGDPFQPSADSLLSGLTEHEVADGARTTDCHLCEKIVRLRDMSAHLKHHELDKAQRPKPAICRNINCGRTLAGAGRGLGPGRGGQVGAGPPTGQGPINGLGLCSQCFTPLYVQLHDPEGKALRRRIERRYLSQMMTGCKKKWCANEWCRTGRTNLGMAALPTGTAALLPLIKPLMDSFKDHDAPAFFCVDESNQRRRERAELLASENAWDLEWCIAACEADRCLDAAREWLGNWAPEKRRADEG